MTIQVVIPSRRRPGNVKHMRALFPTALWSVDPSDAKTYEVPKAQLLIHPPSIMGNARAKQWILDQVQEHTVFIVDDDIKHVWCNVGLIGRAFSDPRDIARIIENAAYMSQEAGACIFGFGIHGDTRKFSGHSPFKLTGWISTAMGFHGRSVRYNLNYVSRADIDLTLRALEKHRIVWRDDRFCFVSNRFSATGGNTGLRSAVTDEADMRRLKREWGDYIKFQSHKTGMAPTINVKRQQVLEIGDEEYHIKGSDLAEQLLK